MKLRIYVWALMTFFASQEAKVLATSLPPGTSGPQPFPTISHSFPPPQTIPVNTFPDSSTLNPTIAQTPSDPSVDLASYYPIISGSAGSSRIVSFFMLVPQIAPATLSAHFLNCNLACCTFAQSKGRKAYSLFLNENPNSIINAFVGHDNDFHIIPVITLNGGLPFPMITYSPGTGTHTGANCFFFCNRFAISSTAIHNIGFMDKFMINFMPIDHTQIGSPEHRKAIRLLAATLSVRSIDVNNPKNTPLHRYLTTSNSLLKNIKDGIKSLLGFTMTDAQKANAVVMMEELRRYHCKVTLTEANDPNYTSLGCSSL